MPAAPDHLTPEQEQREREQAASVHAARARANDAEFMSSLKERLDVIRSSRRHPTMTRDEFLASTETPDA